MTAAAPGGPARSDPERPAVTAEAASGELVTVMIPARDEERTIRGVLESVLGQTHQNLQVIVVDGASTDRTREIVSSVIDADPRVELVHNAEQVIPVALNLAAERARSRWLVRVDAHSRIPADYVERVVSHLRTGRWGGVGGRKNGHGYTAVGRAIAAVTGSPFAQGNSVYHYGTEVQTVDHIPFGAYPVDVVRELGGWSETQLNNEDYEFDYRVRRSGRELLFDPSIEIEWDCKESIGDLFRQYRRYGTGKVQTLATHPESAALRHLAAPSLVGLIAVALVAQLPRRTRRLGQLLLLPYLGLVAAGSVTTVRRLDGPGERLWVAPAFVALHLGWGLGFWQEALRQLRGRSGR